METSVLFKTSGPGGPHSYSALEDGTKVASANSDGSRTRTRRWFVICAGLLVLLSLLAYGFSWSNHDSRSASEHVLEGSSGFVCPGTDASLMHASCKVKVSTEGTLCRDVVDEMTSRVAGQYDKWVDPKNNGTYFTDKVDVQGDEYQLSFHRRTGDDKYTDKIHFHLVESDGKCIIYGCSESQVNSFADFSTNYCEMRNLYCGSGDGCKPVKHDFNSEELKVIPSAGAGTDKKACITL